ncbi:MAG: hypothetical protein R3F44_01300 [Candidatus Competibacteraceae bacterium]
MVDIGRRLIGNLSKGYRQRSVWPKPCCTIRQCWCWTNRPSDWTPQLRETRIRIRALGRDRGVMLSTHLLSEVQATCTHAQIMRTGRLVYAGDLADLEQRQCSTHLRVGSHVPPPVASLAQLPGIVRVEELSHGRF